MADEKPRKARKTATRTPRERAGGDTIASPAPADGAATELETRTAESPVLAIEQASETHRRTSDDVEEIRRRAYELYLSRGAAEGNDLSDWLEAERLVRQRRESDSP